MRTTLNIDDEVLARVRQYAKARKMTLKDAVNFLLERGLRLMQGRGIEDEFEDFHVPGDSTTVPHAQPQRVIDEL